MKHLRKFLMFTVFILAGFMPVLAQNTSDLIGIWETRGYGYILEVETNKVTIYQASNISCLAFLDFHQVTFTDETIELGSLAASRPSAALTLLGILEGDAEIAFSLSPDGDDMLLNNINTVPIRANRIDELPAPCAVEQTLISDPQTNFESFWHMFNEQYAFFDVRGVNWDAQYDIFRPQVTEQTSDQDLMQILSNMLEPLEDGHVNLVNMNADHYSPGELPDWAGDGDLSPFLDLIITNYLIGEAVSMGEGNIIYGMLPNNVGYVNVLAMQGFSSPTVSQVDIIDAAMSEIMEAFANTDVIVVDVRFNGGGSDDVALQIAGYFTDTEQIAFSKQARDGDSFTPLITVNVTPQTETFITQPIYLLTGGLTASAAEIFTMTLRSFPQVTQIGENTEGIFSDILIQEMPNGWIYTLSNEVYYDINGVIFEGDGIPADIPIEMNQSDIEVGIDPILDYVLAATSE